MNLPFTVEQFFDVFARYNVGVWPAQWLLTALALGMVVLVVRGRDAHGPWISAVLALLWAWMALAYHFAYFTAINPAAWIFGAASLLQALLLAWIGVVRRRLRFHLYGGWRAWTGAAFVVFALLAYPLIGHALGDRYPRAPTFGLPCPVTIFTIGVLLLAAPPAPRSVFVIPAMWAAVGSVAAVALGVYADLGLLVAGLAALLAMAQRSRRMTSA
jgi:hypothetical protein